MNFLRLALRSIDWILLGSALLLSAAGLVTMNSFAQSNTFFDQQIIWIILSLGVFFSASVLDWRFLRNTQVVMTIFIASVGALALLFLLGTFSLRYRALFHSTV